MFQNFFIILNKILQILAKFPKNKYNIWLNPNYYIYQKIYYFLILKNIDLLIF
jgi:hypothetical protein